MLIAKLHSGRGKEILAVCDKELLGQKITDGELQLDLSSKFYNGEEISEEEFEQTISNFDMLNMVGERVIGIALRLKLITEEHLITVNGVPHAQCVTLDPVS